MATRTLGRVPLRGLFRRAASIRFGSTLVLAETTPAGALSPGTPAVVRAARQLGLSPLRVLVAGDGDLSTAASSAASLPGVDAVLTLSDASLARLLPEPTAAALGALRDSLGDVEAVVGGTTTVGKDALPRLAGILDVDPITDVVGVGKDAAASAGVSVPEGALALTRPIYAGSVLQTVAVVPSADSPAIVTFRGSAFADDDGSAASGASAASVEAAPESAVAAAAGATSLSSFVSEELTSSSRPELTSAKRVVAGGRGIGGAEGVKELEALADAMGAAMGASRALVDDGLLPNDLQIGQTGKTIAPDLYVAVGISGAIQHVAGIKGSKVIAAINKDPESPIFKVADVSLVQDAKEALPELTRRVKEL